MLFKNAALAAFALVLVGNSSLADTIATNRPHLLSDARWDVYQKTLACWGNSTAGSSWQRRASPHLLWSAEEQEKGMCNPKVSNKYVGGCGSDVEARGESMRFGWEPARTCGVLPPAHLVRAANYSKSLCSMGTGERRLKRVQN
jgi:hypothetical protein